MANGSMLGALTDKERIALHLSATPAGFYVTTSDSLRLSVIASVATTLTASGQVLTVDGEVRPFALTVIATTDRVVASSSTPIADGWLLNVTVQPSSGSPITGQAWARLQIVRGGGAGAFVIANLASGYVTAQQAIVWPFGEMRGSLEGRGAIRSITGTNPAAGVEISETVPTGALWHLLSFFASFSTSATVANRFPHLVIDDGTNVLFVSEPAAAQAASVNQNYTAASGLGRQAVSYNTGLLDLPTDLLLRAGSRINTVVGALDAGDNWSAPQLLVEEWLEGAAP